MLMLTCWTMKVELMVALDVGAGLGTSCCCCSSCNHPQTEAKTDIAAAESAVVWLVSIVLSEALKVKHLYTPTAGLLQLLCSLKQLYSWAWLLCSSCWLKQHGGYHSNPRRFGSCPTCCGQLLEFSAATVRLQQM